MQSYADPVMLGMSEAGPFSIIERSDWRRYDNGRYTGLTRNEVRASILPQAAHHNIGNAAFYFGNFYVLQSTLRDMRESAQAVDAIVPASFTVMRNGALLIEEDRGFPMMRGFPSFPSQVITQGAKWRAPGNRAADPLNLGQAIVIPFTAEYEYRGTEFYNGTLVHRIFATYGYNYQNAITPHPYTRVMGTHRVDILIRANDGLPIFMRDNLNVIYTLTGGATTEFRGFTLTFGTGIVPMDRGGVIASLEDILHIEPPAAVRPPLGQTGFEDAAIDLTPVPEGIKLTIRDIRFVADSPEFLPAERPRLDLLAEALKQIPGRTFLVEGHTASTGRPESEMRLSVERAQSLISEMVRRGLSADRFIYKGWGGTRPIGDNATDAGRGANRRVEVTILE